MHKRPHFQSYTANGARLFSPRHELTVHLHESPPLAVLNLGGFLYGSDTGILRQTIEEAARRGTNVMLFDLSRLSFIDTAGVGALAQLETEADGHGMLCAFVRPARPLVNQALEVCKSPRQRESHDDAESALESLARRIGGTAPMAGMLAAIERLESAAGAHDSLTESHGKVLEALPAQPSAVPYSLTPSTPPAGPLAVPRETYDASLRRIDELEKRLAQFERIQARAVDV